MALFAYQGFLKHPYEGIIVVRIDTMANTSKENTGFTRPVAIQVSSTSSLDSFGTTQQTPCITQQTYPETTTSSYTNYVSIPHDDFSLCNPTMVSSRPSLVPYPVAPSPTTTIPVPIMPSHPSVVQSSATVTSVAPANNTVAEFLYQLTKMLTDDNREVIEWNNGKIEVHNPHKLASDVLHQYFRHSKFASFQRQLNYFGFRKLAGKGKMAPCSYVNDAATSDLRSLLLIKRKTTPATGKEKGIRKRERASSKTEGTATLPVVNPVLAGILHRSNNENDIKKSKSVEKLPTGKGIKHQLNGFLKHPSQSNVSSSDSNHAALAQTAVGKGIKHGYMTATQAQTIKDASSTHNVSGGSNQCQQVASMEPTPTFTFKDPYQLGMDVQSSLSELTNNFQNSLKDGRNNDNNEPLGLGMLSRNSSLVDLAMLTPVEPTPVSELQTKCEPTFMTFIDFPSQELNPSS